MSKGVFMLEKWKKKKQEEKLDETTRDAVCATARDALKSILDTKYTVQNANGEEVVDYELTARMMKNQARLTYDLITKMVKN